MIHAILDGTIEESEFESDPYFGVKVPKNLNEISEDLLIPANAWKDKIEYDKIAKTLVRKFNENFSKYNIDDIDIIHNHDNDDNNNNNHTYDNNMIIVIIIHMWGVWGRGGGPTNQKLVWR